MGAVPQLVSHNNHSADECELTILMPCLNEAQTIADCIHKAQGFLAASGITGEVLIADNGSSDASCSIATRLGARVRFWAGSGRLADAMSSWVMPTEAMILDESTSSLPNCAMVLIS
jgi:hypothetical protein